MSKFKYFISTKNEKLKRIILNKSQNEQELFSDFIWNIKKQSKMLDNVHIQVISQVNRNKCLRVTNPSQTLNKNINK